MVMSDQNLVLDEQLSFILYLCSKETIKRYKEYLDPLGITYTQYLAMLVLWNDNGISVNELSKKMYLDSGTLTPLLKKLEGKNLVERHRDSTDERVVLVSLTKKGVDLKDQIRHIPGEILAKTGVPPQEAADILEMLKSVLDRTTSLNYGKKEIPSSENA
ncbi:MarR family winged helix-turn-helix transcriptional regulator [Salisediminibacterium beveridgei]|uniref:HTH-type transcriptional regulator SarZ n=1 Tax=Salisediminibacterium beveridgei TaxID=632773 RepID=A0A1D7QZ18_9BACI|nr:MarR family transcriptional regulator [Salisediminibacterium beveridgei]AOM84242.1 Organic hydroperoxide resistance transcriptional regulator [Salisediminibacterium beveridgei]